MKTARDGRKIIVSLVQVVLFLFTAFGGFLKKIAPPDETQPGYHVGLLSFLVLIILLTISALARQAPAAKYRRAWTIAGIVCFVIAILSGFLYPRMLDRYTYAYPPEKPTQIRVKGLDSGLTDVAREWIQEHPLESSPGTLARKLPKENIWTPESIEQAKTILLCSYGSLVLSLAAAIFCLIEANPATKAKPQ
ncbi:hypothetical protein [Acidicapsa acidisoli]|uniref:hypothetical protein n=1 Tax=Acidicapsa acidisoli TaxID=1615681 RepID=UPI0021DF93F0|nr:hypothetical protein [Acidicapsa acidisoli]